MGERGTQMRPEGFLEMRVMSQKHSRGVVQTNGDRGAFQREGAA